MWVPIALSRDIPAGATRAVIVDGNEFVAWRGEGGTLQVWEDRCPHRGMRLSYGFVRGDRLNCLYHGWEYGAGASCQRIPAHPGLVVPPTIRANAATAAESGGLVLLQLGASSPALVLVARHPVASVAIDVQAETLFQGCEARPLPGVQAFETTLRGMTFTIGWHAVTTSHLMLHALVRDPGTEPAALAALHGLRDQLEREAA